MNICPITCPIVKGAIEKNKKLGNEKSDWADNLKIDNSKGGDTE